MKKQLIFVVVCSVIVFGIGFAGVAVAEESSVGVGTELTISDLEIDNVGTLPTSRFYFFKQWGRGIMRFFTFNTTTKAELELDITNQIAGEVLEVNKAQPDNTNALQNALENYTNAQERLNARLTNLIGTSENPAILDLLKKVDERTARHTALLEQLSEKNTDQLRFEVVGESLKKAGNNIQKTFTITVTPVNDAPSLKLKAEEQIELAGVAIEEANDVLMQVSTTRGMATEGGESSIFDRWGKSIARAEDHLTKARQALVDGKDGEAYGLARSAEALADGVRVATGDVSGDGLEDQITPSVSPKVNENESPRPVNRMPAERPIPDVIEIPEPESAGSSGRTP